MNNLVKQIKNNIPDLREAEIEGLLHLLKSNKSLENNKLLTLTGLPKETTRQFKKSIANLLDERSDDLLVLNKEGAQVLNDLSLKPYSWSLADDLFPAGDSRDGMVKRILDFRDRNLVSPKREFDQFLATNDSVLNKALVVEKKGLIEGKSIALIGDDDLNSISLALVNGSYKEITVFDVDKNVLDSVKKSAESLGLKDIETVLCDIRLGIDKKYLGKYDVVVFDPPYTRSGVSLFLERAVELLGKNEGFDGKYIFMYYGNSFKSPEKILKIQEVINRFGLSIEDRIEKFARYSGAESIGNASSLYILKVGRFTRKADCGFGKIYTHENQKEEKFPFVDHLVFKLFNVKKEYTLSKNKLVSTLDKICKAHKFKVVDRVVTEFKGGGITVTFVLSNSNFVAHTWPEFGSVHLDLVTCKPIFDKDTIVDTVSKVFETSFVEVTYIE